jgi:1-acyl-sn-glycerol-3-phosphate acyltransferase
MSKTPLFIKIARPTYGAYIVRHYGISIAGMEKLPALDGPFLILGNHTHAMDPFFISAAFPMHIRWVAGAHLFKTRALRNILRKFVGGISKQQGRSDFQTIRDISEAFKVGDIVGLFPEGTRTWDGESLPFEDTTAKLVRLFKVPVVFMHLEGAYALKPRWASKARLGNLTIRIVDTLMPDVVKNMPFEQLVALLNERLSFSHREWQERNNQPFKSSAQAEGLQRLLYLCPECEATSSIVTYEDMVECSQCGLTVRLDAYDRFVPVQGKISFTDVPEWHAWEQWKLKEFVENSDVDQTLFPPDRGVLLQLGVGKGLRVLTKRFQLLLTSGGMVVQRQDSKSSDIFGKQELFHFPFSRIQSMIINVKSTVELYMDDKLYRIRVHKDTSIVKYLEYYLAVQEKTVSIQNEVTT